jgi:hypothetical protein
MKPLFLRTRASPQSGIANVSLAASASNLGPDDAVGLIQERSDL